MVCFDYEEVECMVCNGKFTDDYHKLKNGDIVCDDCFERALKINGG